MPSHLQTRQGTATYLAVYDAKRIANALIEQGVSKGDPGSPTNSRQFASFFWDLDVPDGSVESLYTQTELNKIIAQTKPRVVIGVDIEGLNVPVKMGSILLRTHLSFQSSQVEPEIDIDPPGSGTYSVYRGNHRRTERLHVYSRKPCGSNLWSVRGQSYCKLYPIQNGGCSALCPSVIFRVSYSGLHQQNSHPYNRIAAVQRRKRG